jgi:predicted O-methyltransferase YrrM
MSEITHPNSERWTRWLAHLFGKPLFMLEIGSYKGESARWFLDHLLTHADSKLLCVDTWQAGEGLPFVADDSLLHEFLAAVEPWKDKCGVRQGRSYDVLPLLTPMEYDIAYVDASHTAANVLADSVLTWRLVKNGGLILWDDYLWEAWNDPLRQPKLGIDCFLKCYAGKFELIEREWQVIVKKLTD